MSKQQQLNVIASQIDRCRLCKKEKSGKSVPGEGNPDADIVFLGEAPGRNEASTGRPFIGRSGQLLRKTMRDAGFREEDVFITSPVKYLPDRGTPTKEHIKHGKIHLDKQLAVIAPKVIVLMGSTAVYAMLGTVLPILKEHGKTLQDHGRTYFIMLHPAAVLRFPKYSEIFVADFAALRTLLQKKSYL